AFYARAGADEIVFLDITASSDGRAAMIEVAERTGDGLDIPFTVGGGLRSVEDMRRMLAAGADKTSLNTAAVRDPDLIARGAAAFLAASIFHFGDYSIAEAKRYLAERGVPVRP